MQGIPSRISKLSYMNPHTNSLTLDELQQQNKQLTKQNIALAAQVKWYEEQFRLAQQKRFGASSEKTDPDQLSFDLFNEAEVEASPEEEKATESISYERRKRAGKREADWSTLPVETVVYTLPEDEQACSCCGNPLHEMTTQTRNELAIVPAKVKVMQHVQQVYACRHCEREAITTPIVIAPMPKPVQSGSLASPSMLAHVMCQKYVESLPLYRQEQAFTRLGYALSRQTMANWMMMGAEKWLTPLYAAIKDYLLQQDVLYADETTLQVLKEPGKAAETHSYLWLYRTGSTSAPAILYDYQRTRGGEHPKRFLATFQGYLHVDGYAGYHKVKGATLVGCWAHARRKYDEAIKGAPPETNKLASVSGQGLAFCNQLYAIERELASLAQEERYAERQKRSKPVLETYEKWLKQQRSRTLPKSLLGQAIAYSLNQWEKLTAFLQDGRLELDNNRSERSIKPFVIGRKNWLFANTPRGAQASATIYSVMESAKENGLIPYEYLKYIFEQLPQIEGSLTSEQLASFLPWSATLPAHVVCKRNA